MHSGEPTRLHVIYERDVGLFSLFQQVIAQIPWAKAHGRTPVVYFGDRCAYFVPGGYKGKNSVWEYYFEPLVPEISSDLVPKHVRDAITAEPLPSPNTHLVINPGDHLISCNFGHDKRLRGNTLRIPFRWEDPKISLRRLTAELINEFVRPTQDLQIRVNEIADDHFGEGFVIGVHIRGTDAISARETRDFRKGSLNYENFVRQIRRLVEQHSDAKIFVATDEQRSIEHIQAEFGNRVIFLDSIRHQQGDPTGAGPTGDLMPGYITGDPRKAAQNGEEAIIEWLLLCRADHLVHNGASLARTALLANASLPHNNVHLENLNLASRYGPSMRRRADKLAREFKRLPYLPERMLARRANRKTMASKDLIEQVRHRKNVRSDLAYNESPNLTFIVHSFNRVGNVGQLAAGLKKFPDCELVVCEDGSIDGSLDAWIEHLDRPNDFLLRANDLHEIRILDRAIRMSSGDIVCLIQDDDLLPNNRKWVDDVLAQYVRRPRLAIVGGFMGASALDDNIGERPDYWGGEDFHLVHHVNIGPYFIRRSAYFALGGWDFSFSGVGEPGVGFDVELCLRAWLSDFEVGYRFAPLKGPAGYYGRSGGTLAFTPELRESIGVRNHQRIIRMYQERADEIQRSIAAAKKKSL